MTGIRIDARTSVPLFLALLAPPVVGQQVLQASADYQPLTYTDAAGYKGCGIRASVLFPISPRQFEGADFSVNVWGRPRVIGLVKIAGLHVRAAGETPDLRKAQPAAFSISLEKDGVPIPLSHVEPGEEQGYLIAATPVDAALDLMTAMLAGERVVIGITAQGDKGERRFVFDGQLEAADLKAIHACTAKAFAASS